MRSSHGAARWTLRASSVLSTAVLLPMLLFLAGARADTGFHAGDDLQRFVTRPDLMPPKWQITYHDRSRVAPGYWLIAPYRFADNHLDDVKWVPCEVGPMIFDGDGELVWSGACKFGNRISFDFGVTELKGSVVLKGNLKKANFPEPKCGAGWFLNSKYELEHSILLAKDVDDLNQHEFNIEDQGKRTMIITHSRKHLDAGVLGAEGKVWVRSDGFRELDTGTGKVLFDWKTEDHISLNESTFTNPAIDGPEAGSFSQRYGWDAYHANSATKNSEGDYLLSIRHTDTLALVSGKDGHVIWRCGGILSDFTFEKNAKFSRQHDARYLSHSPDRSVISLMDNAIGDMSQDHQSATHDYSRGLILELEHKTGSPFVARMVKEYARPDGGYGDRRGNTQILPNGNVFMVWTDGGYLSEHTDDDEVLMEAKWMKKGRFGTYRGYKYDGWVGRPETVPDVKALGYGSAGQGNTLAIYVSWNGATEVKRWRFFAGGRLVGETEKRGFETAFAGSNLAGKVQVEALDADGKSLARSEEVDIEWVAGMDGAASASESAGIMAEVESTVSLHPLVAFGIFVLSAIATVGGFSISRALLKSYRRRSRRRGLEYKEIPLEEPVLAR